MAIMAAAETRYLHEPQFHAKVETVVLTIERESGVVLDSNDRGIAVLTAAVALNQMPWA